MASAVSRCDARFPETLWATSGVAVRTSEMYVWFLSRLWPLVTGWLIVRDSLGVYVCLVIGEAVENAYSKTHRATRVSTQGYT